MAVLILGIVAAGIGGFLSAVGARGSRQLRMADPAIEAVIAIRRLGTLAPAIRCVLLVDQQRAIVWLCDDNPNSAVNTSEIGLLRFDEANDELVLETLDRRALLGKPALEQEYEDGKYAAVFTDFDGLRKDGVLVQRVLAEGLESVEFTMPTAARGTAEARFRANDYETLAVIAPMPVEEPLR